MTDVFETAFTQIMATMASLDDDVVVATYAPATGAPVSITGHFSRESFESPDGFNFGPQQTERTFEALLDDFGRTPERGETLTINSVAYEIQETIFSDERLVKAIVK